MLPHASMGLLASVVAIDDKMEATSPKGRESKEAFLNRLKKCARTLPRSFVRKAIGKMRKNIQGVIDAGGFSVPTGGFCIMLCIQRKLLPSSLHLMAHLG